MALSGFSEIIDVKPIQEFYSDFKDMFDNMKDAAHTYGAANYTSDVEVAHQMFRKLGLGLNFNR